MNRYLVHFIPSIEIHKLQYTGKIYDLYTGRRRRFTISIFGDLFMQQTKITALYLCVGGGGREGDINPSECL